MKYNIREGHFSSGIHLGLHFGRVSQTYKVRFDSSCLYDDIDWERDYNKLTGWSYSNLPYYYNLEHKWQAPHHNNSLRFGWRANKKIGKIDICLYIYQDGLRTITDFVSIDIDKNYILGIFYKVDEYHGEKSNPRVILTATQKEDLFIATKTINLSKPFDVQWSYKLYPYFGGNNPAPNNMSVQVTET